MTVQLKSSTMSETCWNCGHVNIMNAEELPVLKMVITKEGKLRMDKYDLSLDCTECEAKLLHKETKMAMIVQAKVEKMLPTMWD